MLAAGAHHDAQLSETAAGEGCFRFSGGDGLDGIGRFFKTLNGMGLSPVSMQCFMHTKASCAQIAGGSKSRRRLAFGWLFELSYLCLRPCRK